MPRAKASKTRATASKAKAKTSTRKTTAKKAAPKKAVAKKKTTVRKVVAKKATTKKKAASKKAAPTKRIVAIPQKQTKTQIVRTIAEETELPAAQVKLVLESLQGLMSRHMQTRGSGEFTIPEVGVKVRRIRKKATKKRLGRNPFTGEEIMIPPKPARDVIKVTAMKALKELIA